MTPSPYLTGDMPSSGAAVNAIVGGSSREAVVAGAVLFHVLKTTPGWGEMRLGGLDAPRLPSPLLPEARRNHSSSPGQPIPVTAPKIA